MGERRHAARAERVHTRYCDFLPEMVASLDGLGVVVGEGELEQELGLGCPLTFLYKFEYQASYKDLGSEHELCSVYLGLCDGAVSANRNEIEDWRFVAADALDREMDRRPEDFTPWFRMEWEQVKHSYRQVLGLD